MSCQNKSLVNNTHYMVYVCELVLGGILVFLALYGIDVALVLI